jgi:lipid-binding SYLF domain-containing protein
MVGAPQGPSKSFGFQIGGEATDFVLLVVNERGATGILSTKVKLGADASVAAGPVGPYCLGRNRRHLACGHLELFPRGAFVGVSLEGSTIRPDNGANKQIYGQRVPARRIVLSGEIAPPPSARVLISTLDSKTPEHKS